MQTTQLKTAEVYSLISTATWIRCDAGQLWISHDGQDIVLERGEKCFLNGSDRIVLEALLDSRFSTYQIPAEVAAVSSPQFEHVAAAH